jgi:hypothetical protein
MLLQRRLSDGLRSPETGISLESRDLGAENKAVTDTTFIRFRGPQALHDSKGTAQLTVSSLPQNI